MKTYISIFHNLSADDYFAAIAQGQTVFCYSLIGQHSDMTLSYLLRSVPAPINEETVKLYNEIKQIYADEKPVMMSQDEFLDMVMDEQLTTAI